MLKTYITQLKAGSDEANREREKAKLRRRENREVCGTSIASQLETLMRSLSPVQKDKPWSMDEFIARLHGRYSANPHPMHIGQALRSLGWEQRRDWTRDGGGKL